MNDLKNEEQLEPYTFIVDSWTNFCRVFAFPQEFENKYCFGGGIPTNFQMVDWFYPVQGVHQAAVTKNAWLGKFGNLDGTWKKVTLKELQDTLTPFLQEKQYIKKEQKYLVICDFGASFVFTGNPK